MPRTSVSVKSILSWPRSAKRSAVVALDVILSLFAMWMAFTLRLDAPHWPTGIQWVVYVVGPALSTPIYVRFGLYRAIFRYTGLAALIATAQATAVYGLTFITFLLILQASGLSQGVGLIPRSVGILQPLIFLLLVGASRAAARFWIADIGRKAHKTEGRVVIYGAGTAGVQTAAALSSANQYELVGFVDDDSGKAGQSINDLPVFKHTELAALVKRSKITDILLAIPSAPRARRTQIIESLQHLPVHIRTLPGMADLTSGRVTAKDLQELDIEDLLGREPVKPNIELIARKLTGKCVLVTGAGGSIGSELCRQIVRQAPYKLVLIDHNEFGLYNIDQELQAICISKAISTQIIAVLASATNFQKIDSIFNIHNPQTIYHAAAYKHVPLVEKNPSEGILNNVFGTLNIAKAAIIHSAECLILISTDKAVRPTNIMGASKRVAELILQALAKERYFENNETHNSQSEIKTCFSMVRFGNVLNSSGSVVPLFRQQIESGGPVTVTHENVTRYFMTIAEAAQLVLQAGAMAKGSEVFILDMGKPVRILDLAHRMIRLSGLTIRDKTQITGDIEVKFTGLRPGEKLYEELLIDEKSSPTEHKLIMRAEEHSIPWSKLQEDLIVLHNAATKNDEIRMNQILTMLVKGYQPTSLPSVMQN